MSDSGDTARLPFVFRYLTGASVFGIAALMLVRQLRHVPFHWPDAIDGTLGTILHYEIWVLIQFAARLLPINALIGLLLILLFAVRWRLVLRRYGGRMAIRPWVYTLCWVELLLYNCALDMDPRTTWLCLSVLPVLSERLWLRIGRYLPSGTVIARVASWLVLFSFWSIQASVPTDRILTIGWFCLMAPLAVFGPTRMWSRDRLLVVTFCVVVVQLGFTIIPREINKFGAELLSVDGYAYTFCEVPDRHKLFVAVPCDRERTKVCRSGYIAEHDTRDLSRRTEHRFFSDDFEGRLVHLACLDDTVQVGMAHTVVDGKAHRENVMEFDVDDPSRFTPSLFGPTVGPRVVFDREHDAVFYSSEFGRAIYRFDRATDELDRHVANAFYDEMSAFWTPGSHLIENGAFHRSRDTMFIVQWLSGSKVFEMNRSRMHLVSDYDTHNGGNHGVAVDDELNRIWVTGVWGLDVIEVRSRTLLKRKWLGLGARLPVIDRIHDLVYVPTTAGRLWVLDRRTMRVVGNLAIGGGSRNPYISTDGTRLFASNDHGYFFWETAELARRFRP